MINTPSMQEMLEAGVHFGHKVSRGNPRMGQYVYGARDGIHIIDLAKSEAKLKEAAQFVYELGQKGGVLLVVGTKKQAREVVESLSKEAQTPYLNVHWVGGLMTNFDEVRRNINKLNGLKKEKEAGTLSRYTKKEQLLIARKIEKYDRELGGIADMDKLPDAIFILDCVSDQTAVKEAIRTGITLIGVSDTNSNPDVLDFAIPANDDGIKSITLTLETMINAYKTGKKEGLVMAEKAAVAKKKEDDKVEAKKLVDAQKAAQKLADEKIKADQAIAIESPVLEETAALEEEIEKAVVAESDRKVE